MTLAPSTDITVVQGATFTMQVTWASSAATPVPISLANHRAHMQIRTRPGLTGTPTIDLTSLGTTPALTLEPGGQTGLVAVRIPATLTATLTKNCAYDLFVINNSDPTDATRLIYGAVILSKSVTVG